MSIFLVFYCYGCTVLLLDTRSTKNNKRYREHFLTGLNVMFVNNVGTQAYLCYTIKFYCQK